MMRRGSPPPLTPPLLASARPERLTLAAEAEAGARRGEEAEARSAWEAAVRHADRLATEMQTLAKVLNIPDETATPMLVDSMTVEPGYEAAVAAALGDDIEAPADETAPAHWRALAPLSQAALPVTSSRCRTAFAPPRHCRAGCPTPAWCRASRAPRCSTGLRPASAWCRATAICGGGTVSLPPPMRRPRRARRLRERNRLGALNEAVDAARAAAEQCRLARDATHEAAEHAARAERQHRDGWRDAGRALEEARRAMARHELETAERLSESSALDEAGRRVRREIEESEAAFLDVLAEMAALPDIDALGTSHDELREALKAERTAHAAARAHAESIESEVRRREQRLNAIAAERAQWEERIDRADRQIEALEARSDQLRRDIAALSDVPPPHRRASPVAVRPCRRRRAGAGGQRRCPCRRRDAIARPRP
jgi:chromosome segregation protein